MNNLKDLFEKLNSRFNGALTLSEDGQAIYTAADLLTEVLKALKEMGKLSMLVDVTAVDYMENYEIVYHVMLEDASMVRIKVKVSKDKPSLPTAIPVWKSANVLEREVFDLMGITFIGHPELKKILTNDDFEGHPLRKDFKLDIIDRFNQ